jgi:hypothetical protein
MTGASAIQDRLRAEVTFWGLCPTCQPVLGMEPSPAGSA